MSCGFANECGGVLDSYIKIHFEENENEIENQETSLRTDGTCYDSNGADRLRREYG